MPGKGYGRKYGEPRRKAQERVRPSGSLKDHFYLTLTETDSQKLCHHCSTVGELRGQMVFVGMHSITQYLLIDSHQLRVTSPLLATLSRELLPGTLIARAKTVGANIEILLDYARRPSEDQLALEVRLYTVPVVCTCNTVYCSESSSSECVRGQEYAGAANRRGW